MITVKAYLYPNLAEVQIFEPGIFNVRNRQVYSRPIKVYQGIDNPIQIVIKNQDQKVPTNLASANVVLTAQIQDPTNHTTIHSYPVTWANVTLGQGKFTLDKTTINSLEQRFYKLTFSANTAGNVGPVYIDDNYGVPLDLEILPAYYS